MNDFTYAYSWVITIIAGLLLASVMVQRETHKRQLCTYSIYATSDYMMINDKLHCKDSGKGYQFLTKPKTKSPHLLEHRSEK